MSKYARIPREIETRNENNNALQTNIFLVNHPQTTYCQIQLAERNILRFIHSLNENFISHRTQKQNTLPAPTNRYRLKIALHRAHPIWKL